VEEKKVRTPQRLKTKCCVFPGCETIFIGRGKAKYCDEHRKAKYRKELYKKNDNEGEAVVIIDHAVTYATSMTRICGLDGCNEEYEITLLPRLYEYPNFCPKHRNQHQRSLFVNTSDKDNND